MSKGKLLAGLIIGFLIGVVLGMNLAPKHPELEAQIEELEAENETL
ncbi:MAG: hypothetical protein ACFFCW_12630 [Candidatus Hodarchaeota archaeon]